MKTHHTSSTICSITTCEHLTSNATSHIKFTQMQHKMQSCLKSLLHLQLMEHTDKPVVVAEDWQLTRLQQRCLLQSQSLVYQQQQLLQRLPGLSLASRLLLPAEESCQAVHNTQTHTHTWHAVHTDTYMNTNSRSATVHISASDTVQLKTTYDYRCEFDEHNAKQSTDFRSRESARTWQNIPIQTLAHS